MRKIPIHWDDLESAFERNAPDTESFLDVSTGQVVSLVAGDPEGPVLRARVAAGIQNYIRVDPASSREQYRWMERFVGSVTEPALRERLVMAIDGKGAFRRFKDVLLAFPAERERWFTYRAELLHWHIQNWLREKEIEPVTPPPWGAVAQPPELAEAAVRPIPHGQESPGEALRRQAREIIDGLAAIELPSAIAFLEFLLQRSAGKDKRQVVDADPDAALDESWEPDGAPTRAAVQDTESAGGREADVRIEPARDAREGSRAAARPRSARELSAVKG